MRNYKILIDTNSLLVLLLGYLNPKLINTHPRTSIYIENDFYNLLNVIGDLKNLIILPNVWTEADNLLNNFNKDHHYVYLKTLVHLTKKTTEVYVKSNSFELSKELFSLGLTDILLLKYSKNCRFLITGDSTLSDYAKANGVEVYDVVKNRNENF